MAKRMKKLNIVIITISDSRTIKTDKSGIKLTSLIKKAGHNVKKKIIAKVKELLDQGDIDIW